MSLIASYACWVRNEPIGSLGCPLVGISEEAFAWSDRKDSAWFGIVMAALLPSLLMLWSYTTQTGLTIFTDLVYLTVVTVAIPYLFSACAQLAYLVSKRRQVRGWQLVRDLTIAGVGVLFSMWVTFAAGYQSAASCSSTTCSGRRRPRRSTTPSPSSRPYPFDVLGAQTQGMIGYWLVQALQNTLPGRQVAVCRFVESTGKPAAIGQLGDAQTLLAGQAGTLVVR